MGKETLKATREEESGNHADSQNKPAGAMANRASHTGEKPAQNGDGSIPSEEHGSCTAAGQINYLTDGLSDLKARMAKLEALVLNMENQASPNAGSRDTSKVTLQQISNVAKQIEVLTEGLRTTPDYNLGKTYNCASCNSNGTIAIKVRCTSCGKENWWGYWPKKSTSEK